MKVLINDLKDEILGRKFLEFLGQAPDGLGFFEREGDVPDRSLLFRIMDKDKLEMRRGFYYPPKEDHSRMKACVFAGVSPEKTTRLIKSGFNLEELHFAAFNPAVYYWDAQKEDFVYVPGTLPKYMGRTSSKTRLGNLVSRLTPLHH